MDWLSEFINIMEAGSKGRRTLKEISKITNINSEEIMEFLKSIYSLSLDAYWGIELYDEKDEIIYDLSDFQGNPELIKVKISKNESNIKGLYDLNDLNYQERWVLYDLLSECKGSFIKEEREKILESFHSEFGEKYKIISENRIIKQLLNIFNFHEDTALTLYDSIVEKLYINIRLINGSELHHIAPIRICYNDDFKKWYLECRKKKDIEYIKMENIASVHKTDEFVIDKALPDYYWGNGNKPLKVKLRVFDEKNAKELAVRFLSRKNIKVITKGEGFFDMEVIISDINLFKRWTRSMIPQVVILEPEFLRKDIKEEITSWLNSYN